MLTGEWLKSVSTILKHLHLRLKRATSGLLAPRSAVGTRTHRLDAQSRIDACAPGAVCPLGDILPDGLVRSPLRLSRPIVLDGNGTTLTAAQEPLLDIRSHGVVLRDLKLRGTQLERPDRRGCAVLIRPGVADTVFDRVEVIGDVRGFRGDPRCWSVPALLDFGGFAPSTNLILVVRLNLPVRCTVDVQIEDVRVPKPVLGPGACELLLAIDAGTIRPGTSLLGTIALKSAGLSRPIVFKGFVTDEPGRPSEEARVLWHGNEPQTPAPDLNSRRPATTSAPIAESVPDLQLSSSRTIDGPRDDALSPTRADRQPASSAEDARRRPRAPTPRGSYPPLSSEASRKRTRFAPISFAALGILPVAAVLTVIGFQRLEMRSKALRTEVARDVLLNAVRRGGDAPAMLQTILSDKDVDRQRLAEALRSSGVLMSSHNPHGAANATELEYLMHATECFALSAALGDRQSQRLLAECHALQAVLHRSLGDDRSAVCQWNRASIEFDRAEQVYLRAGDRSVAAQCRRNADVARQEAASMSDGQR